MKTEKIINEFIENIFGFIQIKPEFEITQPEENVYKIDIEGDNLSFLIGYRGQSLKALENILKLVVLKKTEEYPIIIVDINGYRDQKVERLHEITRTFIDKARFFEKEIEMPIMNPWERRQVHMYVSEYDDLESESTGDEGNRKVVLKPKKIS